jgi:hypothetical protein
MCRTQTACGILGALALAGCAHTDGERDRGPAAAAYRVYSGVPAEPRERWGETAKPDEGGMVGFNRIRWDGAGHQRSGVYYLMNAAVRGDAPAAEAAWRLMEAPFEHMGADGLIEARHEDGKPRQRRDCYADSLFWMAHCSHAILVIQQSPLAEQFRERIAKLRPKLKQHMPFMIESAEYLRIHDLDAANRIFIYAQACGLTGLLLDSDQLKAAGRKFIELGLARQRADGVFLEKGGADSGYQAVSIQFLQTCALCFPDPKLEAALARAAAWQVARVQPTGEVNPIGNTRTGIGKEVFYGRPKGINYMNVFLGLAFRGVAVGDKAALDAALRADAFYWAESARRRAPSKP